MYISENLLEIKKYRPATLHTGKNWYVDFYVYRPDIQKMARKQLKLNNIESITARRKYATGLISRINIELEKGWNPFISEEQSKSYTLLTKVSSDFKKLIEKKLIAKDLRESTVHSYKTYLKKLEEYISGQKADKMNVYQFNKDFMIGFLDNVYNEKNRGSRTRDNYLKFLRLFGAYLVERNFIKVNPADGISVLGKKSRSAKNRTVIPEEIKIKITEYLEKNNRNFLLACQILYFCMIRPREMTFIKISHIDLKRSVIFIPGATAKNYKDAVVTIPAALNSLISEMGIMNADSNDYLFSKEFRPGSEHIRPEQFAHYWERYVRKNLGLPLSIKFYSMKDTGITDMIRRYNDPIIARDQARHHDLSITNIYTPADMMQGNERIKNNTGKF